MGQFEKGHLDPGLREVAAQRISLCMTDKASVPFGGVCGWLGELTMRQAQKGDHSALATSWQNLHASRYVGD